MIRFFYYFLIVLFYFYALVIWGKIAFVFLVMTGIAGYYYFRNYQKTGSWSWKFPIAVSPGAENDPGITKTKPTITFADVAGIDEAKEELLELVDFLKNKDSYLAAGARLPKGVLMSGPPGVGKTLSARAIAGEAGVSMIEMAGSTFVNKYVGVGASNIRALFEKARKSAPCIIFIDEFDSLGKRGSGDTGADHEYDQTINQLLVELDGFSAVEGIILLAATNRRDKIDEALLRPGRFDINIYFNYPNLKGREEILKVHSKGKNLDKNANLTDAAKLTPGLTGAGLADIMNKAAILAGKARRTEITQKDILDSIERVTLGQERRSLVISKEEKEVTAIHEAGHALLAVLLENCDPPNKVSIMPRDRALGITSILPGKERYNVSKEFLADQMSMLYGGRAAEKLVLKTSSAGAKDDIERATNIAIAMVCEYGMSEEFGPIAVTTGRGLWSGSVSPEANVQNEVVKLVKNSYERAEYLLNENIVTLLAIADLLLREETISGEQIKELMEKPS